ncbi:MAG: hypothetical protein ACE5HH_01240 [Candidatus Hydrothermarchaeales archaeon]
MKTRKIAGVVFIAMALIALSGCLGETTERTETKAETGGEQIIQISQILLNPTEYSGKEVAIKAKVEEAVDVAGKAFVKLFDGTGRIIVTFPADREYMLSRGFIFMADPGVIGKTVIVNGTVHLNVPLGEGPEHGAFAYLIEVNTIKLAEE